jgi:hypothetical protein
MPPPVKVLTTKKLRLAALYPSNILPNARISAARRAAAAPSIAALKTVPHSQAHARAAGTLCRHAAAAAAAVMFACSAVAAHAAQHVAVSLPLGTWSTAALSVGRRLLAATSLPNLGVAIFAGGEASDGCTCCHVYFRTFCFFCCAGWVIGCLSGRWLVS